MSRADTAAFEEFVEQRYQKLVMTLVRRGASLADAEDAVQAVAQRGFARWATIGNPDVYFPRAVKHEWAAIVRRQSADLARARS